MDSAFRPRRASQPLPKLRRIANLAAMPTDLRIVVPNRPGTLAATLEVLADSDVNVLAMCGDIRPGERWGYVHICIADAEPAKKALADAKVEIADEHEVVIHRLEDRPGTALEVIKDYNEKERNIEVLYTGGDGGLIIGTEDMRPLRPGVKMEDARYPTT